MDLLFQRLSYKRSGIVKVLDPGDPELIFCDESKEFDKNASEATLR